MSKKSITFAVDSEKVEKLDALASATERDRSFHLNEGARRVPGSERLPHPPDRARHRRRCGGAGLPTMQRCYEPSPNEWTPLGSLP